MKTNGEGKSAANWDKLEKGLANSVGKTSGLVASAPVKSVVDTSTGKNSDSGVNVNEYIKSWSTIASLGNVAKYMSNSFKKGKCPAPTTVVNLVMYGSEKPVVKAMLMSKFNADGLNFLRRDMLDQAKKLLDDMRKESAALNKTMNWTQVMEKAANTAVNNKGQTAKLIFCRNMHQFNVGVALAAYSVFLRERAVAYKVVKARLAAANGKNALGIPNKKEPKYDAKTGSIKK